MEPSVWDLVDEPEESENDYLYTETSSESKDIWEDSEESENIWEDSEESGNIWEDSEESGNIWDDSKESENIWEDSEESEDIWEDSEEVFDSSSDEFDEDDSEEEVVYVDEDDSEEEVVYVDEDGNEISPDQLGEDYFLEEEVESSTTVWTDSIDDPDTQDDHLSSPSNTIEDLTSDAFTINYEEIGVGEVAFSNPLKMSRKDTHRGLTTSIKQMGVLEPISVIQTSAYSDHLAEYGDKLHESTTPAFSGFKYIVLSGFRRLYGAMRNQQETIRAQVFSFRDSELGTDMIIPLALHINRTQPRSPGETWSLLEILESEHSLTPANLEFLLNMEPGDAMRLKDIMSSDFEEIKDDLLEEKKTILQSYNALQKERKSLDRLAEDDAQGIENIEGSEEIIDSDSEDVPRLDEETVKELLELKDMDVELTDDDFAEITGEDDPNYQTTGDRRPLPPDLRNAIFRRDEYTCQICGLHGPAFLGAMIVHHINPVHTGGSDAMENLVTLCDSDHLSLHWVANRDGKIAMTREEYEDYSPEDKLRIKKIRRFAEVIIEARKRTGWKGKKSSPTHRMPGVGVKSIEKAYTEDGRPMPDPGASDEEVLEEEHVEDVEEDIWEDAEDEIIEVEEDSIFD